jgi:hypothetical protein
VRTKELSMEEFWLSGSARPGVSILFVRITLTLGGWSVIRHMQAAKSNTPTCNFIMCEIVSNAMDEPMGGGNRPRAFVPWLNLNACYSSGI